MDNNSWVNFEYHDFYVSTIKMKKQKPTYKKQHKNELK